MQILQMVIVLSLILSSSFLSAQSAAPPPLPSQPEHWLDGKPLQWSEVKGKVVLLNVWTFACWNSYRSFPWIVSLQKKFPDLQIVGIHSPEFDYEKDRKQMRQTMETYGIHYPQVLDDQHEYWNALNNRYWPAFYIIDRNGQVRGKFFGETHEGDNQAAEIEKLIGALQREG